MSDNKKIVDEILCGMDAGIKGLESRLFDLEKKNFKPENKLKAFESEQAKTNGTNYKVKEWLKSGNKNFGDFHRSNNQKGLALNGNTALFESELNSTTLMQAINNTKVLDAFGTRATKNLEYRRTVLATRPQSPPLTFENIGFTAIDQTDAAVYTSINGRFTKSYGYVQMTNESINYSEVDVSAELFRLMQENQSLVLQQQLMFGTGNIGNGKANPTQLSGIFNHAIDRTNTYTKALLPDATRERDILKCLKTGTASDVGTTPAEILANLYNLSLAVHEQYQTNARWMMHPSTLSFLLQQLNGADDHSLFNYETVMVNGVWTRMVTLLGAEIILSQEMDEIGTSNAPIAFGDFAQAYEILIPSNAEMAITDPYTMPDTQLFYFDYYFGGTVVNNQAMATLVSVV